MRALRFLRTLRSLRGHGLLTGHNVRAAWVQSDPAWVVKRPALDLSDAEWEVWLTMLNEEAAA